jgi:predicted HicB family RNase H-like nuclease
MGRLSKVFDTAKENELTDNESKKTLKDENEKARKDEIDIEESKKTRSNEFVNLNFKVENEIRRKVKQYAVTHDISLKELFERAIDFYIEHHP